MPWAARWLALPVLYLLVIVIAAIAVRLHWSNQKFYLLGFLMPVCLLFALEWKFPADAASRTTWRKIFSRDWKYFLANRVLDVVANPIQAVMAIWLARHRIGLETDWPIWLAVPFTHVIREFIGYWLHRWSHEANTPFKAGLWKWHVLHHVPRDMYLLTSRFVHPVATIAHGFLTTFLTVCVLAPPPEAVRVLLIVFGFHAVMVHANLDVRLGWLNYVINGPELHRFHHSGEAGEAKNFAATFSFFDLMFGTLIYRPNLFPARLGVDEPENYPASQNFIAIFLYPFQRRLEDLRQIGDWLVVSPAERPAAATRSGEPCGSDEALKPPASFV